MSPRLGIFVFGKGLLPPLSLSSVQRLLAGDLLDKGGHGHPFCDKTGSRPMHGSQKLAPRIVDADDLSHVDFNFFARAGRREPNIYCFGNPGTAKSASELQATLTAILVNCDS
jgi:hypothetical protein